MERTLFRPKGLFSKEWRSITSIDLFEHRLETRLRTELQKLRDPRSAHEEIASMQKASELSSVLASPTPERWRSGRLKG